MELLENAKELLGSVSLSSGESVEIFLERGNGRTVSWSKGHPDMETFAHSQGIGIRVIRNGCQGLAYANEISQDVCLTLFRRAQEACGVSPRDIHRHFPSPCEISGESFKVDPALFRESSSTLRERLRKVESEIVSHQPNIVKVLRASLSENYGEIALVTSQGTALEREGGSCGYGLEVMAEKNGEVQVYWGQLSRRKLSDLAIEPISNQTAERVIQLIGSKPLPSGDYPIVFEPSVGADFLDLISDAFCADQIQKGKSLLQGKLGKRMASENVTLIDDGRLPDGLGSALFDDEGVPTRKSVLMDSGRVCQYLYDSYTASREKVESTGSAERSGIAGVPSPGTTNFFMKPGNISREELLEGTSRGFLLWDVIGMHTADAISGDFSLGAMGVLVDKGKIVRGVSGVTLSGNILDLLKKIDLIANDLTWFGCIGSPTFRVSSLAVGGS